MELLSNIIWLLVCLGLAGTWFHSFRSAQSRTDRRRSAGALILICLLLFAPISISDDLHMSAIALESSSFEIFLQGAVLHTATLIAYLLATVISVVSITSLQPMARAWSSDRMAPNVTKRPPPVDLSF